MWHSQWVKACFGINTSTLKYKKQEISVIEIGTYPIIPTPLFTDTCPPHIYTTSKPAPNWGEHQGLFQQRWLSTRLQSIHHVSNGFTAVLCYQNGNSLYEDIKNNAWVTMNNDLGVTSEAICQLFSRVTKSRVKIIGKSHHEWPQNRYSW